MKQKLWVMWGVLGLSAIVMAALGLRTFAFAFAIVAAIAGWIAFLLLE